MRYLMNIYRVLHAQNITTDGIVDGADILLEETRTTYGDIEHLVVTVQKPDDEIGLDAFITTESCYFIPVEFSNEEVLHRLALEYIIKRPARNFGDDDMFVYHNCAVTYKEVRKDFSRRPQIIERREWLKQLCERFIGVNKLD